MGRFRSMGDNMEKKVLVPLAEGFEMIEALSVVDVFRRGGVHVDTAALGKRLEVTSSHKVVVQADLLLENCMDTEYDLIVLPGGIPGAENLRESDLLATLLQKQKSSERMYGAICAAPALVLEHHGLLDGKTATCHPLFTDRMVEAQLIEDRVVTDGKCVTGRGAGTSIEFALELLEQLMGTEKRQDVAKGMALDPA